MRLPGVFAVPSRASVPVPSDGVAMGRVLAADVVEIGLARRIVLTDRKRLPRLADHAGAAQRLARLSRRLTEVGPSPCGRLGLAAAGLTRGKRRELAPAVARDG